jgi:hypothetical protein
MRPAMQLIPRCVSFAYKLSKCNAESIALRFDGRADSTSSSQDKLQILSIPGPPSTAADHPHANKSQQLRHLVRPLA